MQAKHVSTKTHSLSSCSPAKMSGDPQKSSRELINNGYETRRDPLISVEIRDIISK